MTLRSLFRDTARVLAGGLVVYLLAASIAGSVRVIGASMQPTLDTGDLLVVTHIEYRLHGPARGDIVILQDPGQPAEDFVKRVIGLPGEHVLIRHSTVYIDGAPLGEPYVARPWNLSPDWPLSPSSPQGELVPSGEYFLLGDNRDHSKDSRTFGYISAGQISGHAVFRYWPGGRGGTLGGGPTLISPAG